MSRKLARNGSRQPQPSAPRGATCVTSARRRRRADCRPRRQAARNRPRNRDASPAHIPPERSPRRHIPRRRRSPARPAGRRAIGAQKPISRRSAAGRSRWCRCQSSAASRPARACGQAVAHDAERMPPSGRTTKPTPKVRNDSSVPTAGRFSGRTVRRTPAPRRCRRGRSHTIRAPIRCRPPGSRERASRRRSRLSIAVIRFPRLMLLLYLGAAPARRAVRRAQAARVKKDFLAADCVS